MLFVKIFEYKLTYMIKINPVERTTLLALSGIFSLRMLGLFMILPVFSLYANQLSSVTPLLVGIALGIYGLTQALLQIPFGLASDHFGRKPLIILGLLLFALGSVVAAVSNSIYGVIIGRSLQGASAIGCVIMALVADLIREEVRVRAMAVIGITIGLSFAIAMVLGPVLTQIGGVPGIFWITAVFSVLAIVMLIAFVPTPARQSKNSEAFPVLSYIPKMLFDKTLMPVYFGVLVLHASLIGLFIKIPLAVQAIGFSEGKTWQFYLPVFLASLLSTAPYLMIMEKKHWIKYGLTGAVFLFGISELGVLIFFESGIGLALSLWVFFTAFNILEASLPAYVSQIAPVACKGTALGIYSSAQFLGLFLGGVLGGYLDANYGMVGILWFCIILSMIWFVWNVQLILRGVLYGKRS
jgi:MFS family permease